MFLSRWSLALLVSVLAFHVQAKEQSISNEATSVMFNLIENVLKKISMSSGDYWHTHEILCRQSADAKGKQTRCDLSLENGMSGELVQTEAETMHQALTDLGFTSCANEVCTSQVQHISCEFKKARENPVCRYNIH